LRAQSWTIGMLAAAVVMVSAPAFAQGAPGQGDPMLQPYGMGAGDFASPYRPPERDPQGVRLVVNGRMVDLSDDRGTPFGGSSFSSGVGGRGPSTLSGSTLSAAAIGNSISISDVRNSTIVINQQNNGVQAAFLNGRRS